MAKEKTEILGREVNLKLRQALFTNLNTKPEKAGTELLERADVSLEFLLSKDELDVLIDCGEYKAAEILWNEEGEPLLSELDGTLAFRTVALGVAELGFTKGKPTKFTTAKLKKISIEPGLKFEATVRCQVRVDPEEELGLLGKLQCARTCKFAFKGNVLLHAASGQLDDAGGAEEQPKLAL